MQTLYPEQLNQYLERSGVPPVLLLFGDDLLLRMDAIDAIRQHFGQDAEKYHWIQSKDFDWKQLGELEQSMSLFGSNTLIELELPENKPGKEGSNALHSYAGQLPENHTLVVIGSYLKKEHQNSRWFKSLSQHGPLIRTQSPDKGRLPTFIHKRAQKYQLQLANGVPELLSDWFEGNLLALDQELRKWQLLSDSGVITQDFLTDASSDSSRFNVFALQESIQAGNYKEALHRLTRLLDEEDDFHRFAWILQREVQLLTALKNSGNNLDVSALFRRNMIWSSQQSSYMKRAKYLSVEALHQLHYLIERLEMALKQDSGESPLILTVHLLGLLCQHGAKNLTVTESLNTFSQPIQTERSFISL